MAKIKREYLKAYLYQFDEDEKKRLSEKLKTEEEKQKHIYDNLCMTNNEYFYGKGFYLENSLVNHKKEITKFLTSDKFIIQLDEFIKYCSTESGNIAVEFFNVLKKAKVLKDDNTPYQEYIDKEYFRVVEFTYTLADSTKNVLVMTLVSKEGVEFIEKIFKENGLLE